MVEEESGVEVHRTRRQFLSAAGTALIGVWSLPNLSAAIQNAVPPCRRPRLKITDVRTAQVMVHGHQVHVRVYTDQGIYGQGEATDAAVGAVPLIRAFKEFLLGQDPLNVDYLFEKLRTNGIFAGAQAGQYVTNGQRESEYWRMAINVFRGGQSPITVISVVRSRQGFGGTGITIQTTCTGSKRSSCAESFCKSRIAWATDNGLKPTSGWAFGQAALAGACQCPHELEPGTDFEARWPPARHSGARPNGSRQRNTGVLRSRRRKKQTAWSEATATPCGEGEAELATYSPSGRVTLRTGSFLGPPPKIPHQFRVRRRRAQNSRLCKETTGFEENRSHRQRTGPEKNRPTPAV